MEGSGMKKQKTPHERKVERIHEQLKDREDYRDALIERRESIEKKIEATEEQIRHLRKGLGKKAA
jgi:hypothetical protein